MRRGLCILATPLRPELCGTGAVLLTQPQENNMPIDKDRTEGSLNQAKGSLKEGAGKLTGVTKLEGEGKADKASGKVQNPIGGIKDAIKGK